jgi:hypothetical protein
MFVSQQERNAYVMWHHAKFSPPDCRLSQLLLLPEPHGSRTGSDSGGMEVGFEERERCTLSPSASGTGTYESKAIGEIAVHAVVHAVIDDAESFHGSAYTMECRVLKREGDSVLVYQRLSPPLVSDRVTPCAFERQKGRGRNQLSQPMGNGERAWSRGKAGCCSVKLCEGSWLLEPSVQMRARDLLGLYRQRRSNPVFKNTGGQIGIRKIFTAIRKQVREPKYSGAK